MQSSIVAQKVEQIVDYGGRRLEAVFKLVGADFCSVHRIVTRHQAAGVHQGPRFAGIDISSLPATGLQIDGRPSSADQTICVCVTSPRPSARIAAKLPSGLTAYTSPLAKIGEGTTCPPRRFALQISLPVRGSYAITHARPSWLGRRVTGHGRRITRGQHNVILWHLGSAHC